MLEGLLDGLPTTATGWVTGLVSLAAGVTFSLWIFLEYVVPIARKAAPGPDPERRAAELWAAHRQREAAGPVPTDQRIRTADERLADRVAEDLTDALREPPARS